VAEQLGGIELGLLVADGFGLAFGERHGVSRSPRRRYGARPARSSSSWAEGAENASDLLAIHCFATQKGT
jgi:hypothetical protein